MEKQKMSSIKPGEALKQIKSAVSIAVVGESGVGKSSLIYSLANQSLYRFISSGIGDGQRGTMMTHNWLMDSRIEKDEHFAVQIRTKAFDSKIVHLNVISTLTKQFILNDYSAEDTIASINNLVMESILEPADGSYHLGCLRDSISTEDFKDAVAEILHHVEGMKVAFRDQVNKQKKESDKKKVTLEEVRNVVMEDIWSEMPEKVISAYRKWLSGVGESVVRSLKSCMGNEILDQVFEFSTKEGDELPFGGKAIHSLFNQKEPYSLIVKEISLACRPAEGAPSRFCIHDTPGCTKEAIDYALHFNPDSILFLMSLEERDYLITEKCKLISAKFELARKLKIPVDVIFNKADVRINDYINKIPRDSAEITQSVYTAGVQTAVKSIEESMRKCLSGIKVRKATWMSTRFQEEGIDPIQKALKVVDSDFIEKFTLTGVLKEFKTIFCDTVFCAMPAVMVTPVVVDVKENNTPAICLKVDAAKFTKEIEKIQNTLTRDKSTVNGYQVINTRRIHGRSVIQYYRSLQAGLGFTTEAFLYGSFSANMKGMLRKVFNENLNQFKPLYDSEAIYVSSNLLSEDFVEYVLQEYINQEFFTCKFPAIVDRVAFGLSYGNPKIREIVDSIYEESFISFDETIRKIQKALKGIYESPEFPEILSEELSNALTELVNKTFICQQGNIS